LISDIESAFWLLFECNDSAAVVSCLYFFHPRACVGELTKLFYCKTLNRLSGLPMFVLTDDALSLLHRLSATPKCRRLVVKTLSRSLHTLRWCMETKGWGGGCWTFVEFVSQYAADDWDAKAAAQTILAAVSVNAE
jgi:hypothetical protein